MYVCMYVYICPHTYTYIYMYVYIMLVILYHSDKISMENNLKEECQFRDRVTELSACACSSLNGMALRGS